MSRSRIVIVGAGFAGYQAARKLSRKLRETAEIVLVNPNVYFLYLPLLPEAGVRIAGGNAARGAAGAGQGGRRRPRVQEDHIRGSRG